MLGEEVWLSPRCWMWLRSLFIPKWENPFLYGAVFVQWGSNQNTNSCHSVVNDIFVVHAAALRLFLIFHIVLASLCVSGFPSCALISVLFAFWPGRLLLKWKSLLQLLAANSRSDWEINTINTNYTEITCRRCHSVTSKPKSWVQGGKQTRSLASRYLFSHKNVHSFGFQVISSNPGRPLVKANSCAWLAQEEYHVPKHLIQTRNMSNKTC